MENKREILKVVDLQKKFHKLEVLKGISTTFHENEVVSIIGPSGGGKSTFLRCLNLLEQPTSGQILFDGTDICTIKGKAIDHCRQRMGMVFQQFNLFNNMDVMRNLIAAPTRIKGMSQEEAQDKALSLLSKVGLADRADAYPSQLSGGQKQRIAIVRSLMMDPEVMLFDEPTSALDPEMIGEVLDVMVNHRIYGKVSAPLNIRSRRDVEAFVENIRTGRSTPLLNVTSGYHFHHVAADQEEILDEIEAALREKGFLADFLSYEQEEVEK